MRRVKLTLLDKTIRGMNREQYKVASHWIRWVAWHIDQKIRWAMVYQCVINTLLYGRSPIKTEDMLIK